MYSCVSYFFSPTSLSVITNLPSSCAADQNEDCLTISRASSKIHKLICRSIGGSVIDGQRSDFNMSVLRGILSPRPIAKPRPIMSTTEVSTAIRPISGRFVSKFQMKSRVPVLGSDKSLSSLLRAWLVVLGYIMGNIAKHRVPQMTSCLLSESSLSFILTMMIAHRVLT